MFLSLYYNCDVLLTLLIVTRNNVGHTIELAEDIHLDYDAKYCYSLSILCVCWSFGWCMGDMEENPGGGEVAGQACCCCCLWWRVAMGGAWLRLGGGCIWGKRGGGISEDQEAVSLPSWMWDPIWHNHPGGESERESVSCPEDTMAGSRAVRSVVLPQSETH